MKLHLRVFAAVVGLAIVAAAAAGGYEIGVRQRGYSAAQVDYNMGEIQTTLQFNHLLEYQKVQQLLLDGCPDGALLELKIDVDQQMTLIAGLHKTYPSAWADHYMVGLDPKILSELAAFKSAYGDSWNGPVCKKQSAASGSTGAR